MRPFGHYGVVREERSARDVRSAGNAGSAEGDGARRCQKSQGRGSVGKAESVGHRASGAGCRVPDGAERASTARDA